MGNDTVKFWGEAGVRLSEYQEIERARVKIRIR